MLPPDLPLLLLTTSGLNPESYIICQHSNSTEFKGLGVNMNFYGTFALHVAEIKIKFDTKDRQIHRSSLSGGYKNHVLRSVG
jgi:hypothetical protein